MTSSLEKWLDPGFVFKVQATIFAAEVDMGYRRMREVKNYTKIFDLRNWKNEVNSESVKWNGEEQGNSRFREIIRSLVLNVSYLKCLLAIQVEMQTRQLRM